MIAALLFAALPQDPGPFVRNALRIPRHGTTLALRDADGDGDQDLFQVGPGGIAVRLQEPGGHFSSELSKLLYWPSKRLAWDLEDLEGDGSTEVLLFIDGAQVRSYAFGANGAFGDGRLLLEAKGWLPPGAHRVNFARDVDGDGRTDLVLPDQRAHRIHLANQAGDETPFADPLEVRYSASVNYEMGDPQSLDGRFGRSVRVPWFELWDVDGDGTRDLISRTPEQVAFHLARPTLEAEPSWILDLAELAKQLPRQEGVNLDDLLSNIEDQVQWRIADLDGELPNDLVIGLGAKFQVFRGGSREGPVGPPDQVLKSSGKVLAFFVRQVIGDQRPDLQLLRGERISLGRALRYLILPGRLDFEVYTYVNEAGTFARRPTQRGTLGLEVPRLLSFADDAEGVSDAIDSQFEIPAVRLDWDGDGKRNDIADVVDNRLIIVKDRAPNPSPIESLLEGTPDLEGVVEAFVLTELDGRGDQGELVFDLDELPAYDLAPGAILRKSYAGASPTGSSPFGQVDEPTLRVTDLDGDGRDDLIGWGLSNEEWDILLFVRR